MILRHEQVLAEAQRADAPDRLVTEQRIGEDASELKLLVNEACTVLDLGDRTSDLYSSVVKAKQLLKTTMLTV